jgi:protein tyrosine phosphatase (PTP) superfamily phosphohydrolase (DUF442 family)
MKHASLLLIACGTLAAVLVGCRASSSSRDTKPAMAQPPGPALTAPTLSEMAPRDFPGLHNVVAYHDGYLSGSMPEGDAGFDSLAAMGIKTIITVDAAIPDVAQADSRGMRYIHLPIAYNGFDEKRTLELVRATRDALASGPVYIHCHHGKHRSAGAAGTVVASLGWATPEAMVERMKVSGTAAGYKGLWSCTATAVILTTTEIDATPADFPSVSRPTEFVDAMVEADHAFEHLKQIEAAGWKTPADHPDLVPVAEAGRLADLLRLMADGDRARAEYPDFAEKLRGNTAQAQTLENWLLAGTHDPAALSGQLKLIAASCKECHVKYRD